MDIPIFRYRNFIREADFPFDFRIRNNQDMPTIMHAHDHLQICYMNKGKCLHLLRHSQAVSRVLAYVHEYYSRELRLEDMAKLALLSAPYFSGVFKEITGSNFTEYVNRIRIQSAIPRPITGETHVRPRQNPLGLKAQPGESMRMLYSRLALDCLLAIKPRIATDVTDSPQCAAYLCRF